MRSAVVLMVLLSACVSQDNTPSFTASGFEKLTVSEAEYYPNGAFTVEFVNAVGADIKVVGASMSHKSGQCALNPPSNPVPPGESFSLTSPGCGTKSVGDGYEADVKLTYKMNLGGETVTSEEYGVIKGSVQPFAVK